MREKISKLIRKYVDIMQTRDVRPNGTKERPDYVIKQKLKKMNFVERTKFFNEMRSEIKKYE